MKVILTNNQFNTLMESLGVRFTISEVRVTFLDKTINEGEDWKLRTPPHRLLATYLGNKRISPYRPVNRYSMDPKDPNNPFNDVPCVGVSYYFHADFTVDGKPVHGLIRISDHPAAPETFAKRGYDYGLSVVFDNESIRVGKHSSVEATVYEYIAGGINTEISKIRDISSRFLEANGLVKIEHDKVVSPSGLDFKRITKFSDKQAAREINLITTDDVENDSALFMSPPDIGIHLIAQKDRRGNYHISKDDMKKFNFGDVIKFYHCDGTLIGRPLTIDA